jgi:hypothetical protein
MILSNVEIPIAQLIVEEVRGIPFLNESVFKGQISPEGEPAALR